jgi:hypothetical protein
MSASCVAARSGKVGIAKVPEKFGDKAKGRVNYENWSGLSAPTPIGPNSSVPASSGRTTISRYPAKLPMMR